MNEFITSTQETVRTAATFELNGVLAIVYTLWEHVGAVLCGLAMLYLLARAAEAQRLWITGVALLSTLAAFLSPAPIPFLLAGMAMAAIVGVGLERFNPDALRWRVAGALALYACAVLAHLAYGAYLDGLDARAWAEAIGGQAEAQQMLSQGRAFLNTLATWGLWLILPLGYLSLLVQGVLAHPPLTAQPADTIAAVRTRRER